MTIEQIEIVNNIKFSIIKAIDNIESEQMWEMIEKAYEQKEKDHCEDYLKKRDKDYVHYNVKWLLDNWEQELEILSGGEIKPCGDCVSRQAVKDMLTEEWAKYMPMELDINLSFVLEKISELPSVTSKPNRCDSCTHSEEQDGSNCYECVKGMADNFETQPTDADCISRAELLARIDAERKHLLDIKMDGAEHIIVHHARRIIEDMPSITPTISDVENNYNIGYNCGYADAMFDISEGSDSE